MSAATVNGCGSVVGGDGIVVGGRGEGRRGGRGSGGDAPVGEGSSSKKSTLDLFTNVSNTIGKYLGAYEEVTRLDYFLLIASIQANIRRSPNEGDEASSSSSSSSTLPHIEPVSMLEAALAKVLDQPEIAAEVADKFRIQFFRASDGLLQIRNDTAKIDREGYPILEPTLHDCSYVLLKSNKNNCKSLFDVLTTKSPVKAFAKDKGYIVNMNEFYEEADAVLNGTGNRKLLMVSQPLYSPNGPLVKYKGRKWGPRLFYPADSQLSASTDEDDLNPIATILMSKPMYGNILLADICVDRVGDVKMIHLRDLLLTCFCRYVWNMKDKQVECLPSICRLPSFFNEKSFSGSFQESQKKPTNLLREILSRSKFGLDAATIGGMVAYEAFKIFASEDNLLPQYSTASSSSSSKRNPNIAGEIIFIKKLTLTIPNSTKLPPGFSNKKIVAYFAIPELPSSKVSDTPFLNLEDIDFENFYFSEDDAHQNACLKLIHIYDQCLASLIPDSSNWSHLFRIPTNALECSYRTSADTINIIKYSSVLNFHGLTQANSGNYCLENMLLSRSTLSDKVKTFLPKAFVGSSIEVGESPADVHDDEEVIIEINQKLTIPLDEILDPLEFYFLKESVKGNIDDSSCSSSISGGGFGDEGLSELHLNLEGVSQSRLHDVSKTLAQKIFVPSLCIQRQSLLNSIISDKKVETWLDAGCGMGTFVEGFIKEIITKKSNDVQEIFGIDLNGRKLGKLAHNLKRTFCSNDVTANSNLFKVPDVHLYEGSLIEYERFVNDTFADNSSSCRLDFISLIEVIEHLPSVADATNCTVTLLRYFQPKYALITTPNIESNQILQYYSVPLIHKIFSSRTSLASILAESPPGIGGTGGGDGASAVSNVRFREADHKFEFTRAEFVGWTDNVIKSVLEHELCRGLQYKYEVINLGSTLPGMDVLGPATQCALLSLVDGSMADFSSSERKSALSIDSIKRLGYNVVGEVLK